MQHQSPYTLFLGFGSNIGHRRQTIMRSVKAVDAIPGYNLLKCSGFYESPAMLPKGAPKEWDMPFVNAVAMFETIHVPSVVLSHVQFLEKKAGKQVRGFWGPREIDIDILACGDQVVFNSQLQVPHPALSERDFVLLPWREVAPEWVYPVQGGDGGLTIAQLCDRLANVQAKELMADAA